jgi:O-antigen/teichoic acid export membrane protein
MKHSAWPEFSYLLGARDLDRARRLSELVFEATWVSTLFVAVLLYFAGAQIMSLWTHRAVTLDQGLLFIFLSSAVLNSMWFVGSAQLMGSNEHGRLALWYLGMTMLALLLAWPMAARLGLHGIALSMIVCEACMLPVAVKLSCALLDQPIGQFLSQSLLLRRCRLLGREIFNRGRGG